MRTVCFYVLLALVASSPFGCSWPKAVRGGEGTGNPNLDKRAMSLTLDKLDIDYLVAENLKKLETSPFWTRTVEPAGEPPTLAIWEIENATTQHLSDQMLELLQSIETHFVNTGDVRVISRSRQQQLAKEIGLQRGGAYDPTSAQRLGKQLGAAYFVAGRISAIDERDKQGRRVQYRLFVQVLEVETGVIKFQNEASRSKAMRR